MTNPLVVIGDWLIAAGVRLKWRGANSVRLAPEPPAPPVVTRIPVKPGNLGTLNGYSLKIPVRIIKRVIIEVEQR